MAFDIPLDTLLAQANASHPDHSAWVSANAGSGKTFVLARRVIRLLLNGTEPSRILCLTFTKAAAAEMSNRVFSELSSWTALSDDALKEKLKEIEGKIPDEATMQRARRLFARALETPGGLKIQTIHAFAERLLHQFPLEANVPAHFEILDDQLSAELLQMALSHAMRSARLGLRPDWQDALNRLIDHMGDGDIQTALTDLVRNREGFGRFLDMSEGAPAANGAEGLDAALNVLAHGLGLAPGESLDALDASLPYGPGFDRAAIDALASLFETGGKRDKDQAALMRALLVTDQLEDQIALWQQIFRRKDGAAKADSTMASKKMREADPSLSGRIDREQARLEALKDKRSALLTLDVSRALFTLADGVIGYYERSKAARGLMDFDDLILKAADLLRPINAAAWVHYKLDQGIDHILVDEAQDTNPHQWAIIRQLGEEFFSGDSGRAENRTIFAVGDEKQSIYSFQGAEPKWFANMRRFFKKRAAEAQKPFHDIKLRLSFRSTPHILRSVDAVFSSETTYEALSSDKEATTHEPIRRKDPGLVEIWPLYQPVDQEIDEDWAKPLDAQGDLSPPVQLSRMIARTIRHWIEAKEPLEGRGRAIQAGDILVLVRKRGAFVTAVNRALKEEGLPVAGADRLALLDHIAVMDLLALGEVMLLPEDDLSLASILKSPLFGLSEDRLFDLAHQGGKRQKSLWDSLKICTKQNEPHNADLVAIYEQLSQWQSQVDFQPPFDFFAQILGPDGKRRAFVERLGPEADEVIDEFLSRALDFEKSQTPNLQAFLAAMRQGGAEIKRDMGAADDQIRVMTVHGSKGLEAPIVFLVDGTGHPSSAQHHPHLVTLVPNEGNDPIESNPAPIVWKAPSAHQPKEVKHSLGKLDQEAEEEYLRLLYVAMTRAEDRLYLCGYQGKREASDNCWYQVAKRSLSDNLTETIHPLSGDIVYRWHLAGSFAPKSQIPDQATAEEQEKPKDLPGWLTEAAPPPSTALPTLQPSRAADREEADSTPPLPPAPSLAQNNSASHVHQWEPRRRGLLIHSLFEHLPQLDEADRWHSGLAYLERMARDMPEDARHALLTEVIALLDHPDYSAFFSSQSIAELSITGHVTIHGEEHYVSGQIDRLLVAERDVTLIDFKTNRKIPGNVEDIPFSYQLQMALYARLLAPLYPEKKIRCKLLWTAAPRIMEVTEDQRRSALCEIGVDVQIGS